MQRLEVSGVVRLIYRSLGVKGLTSTLDGGEWSASCPDRLISGEMATGGPRELSQRLEQNGKSPAPDRNRTPNDAARSPFTSRSGGGFSHGLRINVRPEAQLYIQSEYERTAWRTSTRDNRTNCIPRFRRW